MSDANVVMIYGQPGCGKTYAIAQCARKHDFGDVHFINTDRGGIRTAMNANREYLPGITGTNCNTLPEFIKEWQRVEKRRDVPESCQTIVIDSLTAIDTMIIQKESNSSATDPFNVAPMDQQKWGRRQQQISRLILFAHDFPYNYVIFIGHERAERNKDGQIVKRRPAAGSQSNADVFEGQLSAYLHMSLIGRDKRVLTCNFNPTIAARCRDGGINATLDANGQTSEPLHKVLALI